MKKLTTTALFAAALLFGFTSCNSNTNDSVEQAQQTNEEKFNNSEVEDRKITQSDFMTKAASSGMFEVESGKLAQQKAQNQEVKNFGQMMASDHGKANSDLKSLASQKNITLPDSMSQEHMDKIQELRDKQGAEFDQAYMDMVVTAHDNDISMFESAAQDLEDQEVKSFATSKLPVLREHREQANRIKENLNNR